MKSFILLLFLISIIFTIDGIGSWYNQIEYSQETVAMNFADALPNEDVVIGVFETAGTQAKLILDSGQSIRSIPGFTETLRGKSLVILKTKETLYGEIPPFLFVSTLHSMGERYFPFIPISGSRWILALQIHKNNIPLKMNVDVGLEPVEIIETNMASVVKGNLGSACLFWREEKGLEQPNYIVNIDSTVIDDLRRIFKHRNENKVINSEPAVKADELQNDLKSNFGKTMYQRMMYHEEKNQSVDEGGGPQ